MGGANGNVAVEEPVTSEPAVPGNSFMQRFKASQNSSSSTAPVALEQLNKAPTANSPSPVNAISSASPSPTNTTSSSSISSRNRAFGAAAAAFESSGKVMNNVRGGLNGIAGAIRGIQGSQGTQVRNGQIFSPVIQYCGKNGKNGKNVSRPSSPEPSSPRNGSNNLNPSGPAGTGSAGTGSAGTGSSGTGPAGTGPAGLLQVMNGSFNNSRGTGSSGTGSSGTGPAGLLQDMNESFNNSNGTGPAGTGPAGTAASSQQNNTLSPLNAAHRQKTLYGNTSKENQILRNTAAAQAAQAAQAAASTGASGTGSSGSLQLMNGSFNNSNGTAAASQQNNRLSPLNASHRQKTLYGNTSKENQILRNTAAAQAAEAAQAAAAQAAASAKGANNSGTTAEAAAAAASAAAAAQSYGSNNSGAEAQAAAAAAAAQGSAAAQANSAAQAADTVDPLLDTEVRINKTYQLVMEANDEVHPVDEINLLLIRGPIALKFFFPEGNPSGDLNAVKRELKTVYTTTSLAFHPNKRSANNVEKIKITSQNLNNLFAFADEYLDYMINPVPKIMELYEIAKEKLAELSAEFPVGSPYYNLVEKAIRVEAFLERSLIRAGVDPKTGQPLPTGKQGNYNNSGQAGQAANAGQPGQAGQAANAGQPGKAGQAAAANNALMNRQAAMARQNGVHTNLHALNNPLPGQQALKLPSYNATAANKVLMNRQAAMARQNGVHKNLHALNNPLPAALTNDAQRASQAKALEVLAKADNAARSWNTKASNRVKSRNRTAKKNSNSFKRHSQKLRQLRQALQEALNNPQTSPSAIQAQVQELERVINQPQGQFYGGRRTRRTRR